MTLLLKMYGERNTNTNYLSRLIQANLHVEEIPGVVPPAVMKLQSMLPGNELVRDIYFGLAYGRNLGWKHGRVKSADDLGGYSLVRRNNIAFLSITKNPYSWLLSLHRRPYHQYYSIKPDFETFLQRPWKTLFRDNAGSVLKSPVELWNVKNRSYLQLAELNGLNLTTEGIFEDPESVIETIQARFSVARKSGEFVQIGQSTKGDDKDFEYYRSYYLDEKWRDELSGNATAIINGMLDRDLMSAFGYRVLP
ncbi:hypothetical protein [Holophaga foetida]|uniref:hypothetical protein n=1 Tax=Holophaga foetida TaxID=35839 RepID=UPI000247461E|nr:hypothetical protein [Holophaga foetida]